MDPDAFLYDAPPDVLEGFYRIMDTGGDTLGWRGLAVRILPTYLEVRMLERLEAAGRSPTRELLWTWAQQNSRVRDLVKVLGDMGHHRALQLFQGPPQARSSAEKQPHVITLSDVIGGTCSFHPEMRISEGHFSNVYRAQIGNTTFAVKLFKQITSVSWKKLWDVFRKEMEIHHTYQHPNILDLLACFSDEDHYCVVYPYLPNGSLFHRLHQQDGELPLSWEERLAIIKGTAKALHHLQTARPRPVVCGNISSTNVLLDDALQPKLSDFGLARLRPHSATQYCTVTLDTSRHSNLGYLPEEYIRDGKLSASLDVYSFGMVIMETVTGRKVKEEAPPQMLLRDLLVTEVEESGGVDSCLRFLDGTAGQWPAAVAGSLLALALDCTAGRPRHRPSTENVLLALSQLLPLPRCPPADRPRSLDHGAPIRAPVRAPRSPPGSVPAEQDERRSLPGSAAPAGPCECSQSEVTYPSDAAGAHGEDEPDLYSSWPVECSCSAEAAGLACEDCRANMLTPDVTGSPQYSSMVENEAKSRLRNKLSLYDKGLIHTEELFSETGLQERVESLQLS